MLAFGEIDVVAPELRSLRSERSKRWLDVVGAAGALVLFAPLMLLLALLVRLDGGPAMFAHRRVGRYGRPFPCLKFRTMVVDAEARLQAILASDPQARAQWERERKLHADPRITRLGAFMRTTSLDELPQLINVLRMDLEILARTVGGVINRKGAY